MKDRIQKIMKHYNLTAVQFAGETGIQRSALSHVMSGRNKPSLDFVLKIKQRYRDINTDWLLLGEGKMFNEEQQKKQTLPEEGLLFGNNEQEEKTDSVVKSEPAPVYHSKPVVEKEVQKKSSSFDNNEDSEIEKIIFFYRDGSFKTYRSR